MKKVNLFLLLVLLVGAALTSACSAKLGNLVHQDYLQEITTAETVNLEIFMNRGMFNFRPQDGSGLAASLDVRTQDALPKLAYEENGNQGSITFLQDEDIRLIGGDQWNMNWGKDIPLSLNLTVGPGVTNLGFDDLKLTGLDIASRGSIVVIDLSTIQPEGFEGIIYSVEGRVTLIINENQTVRISVEGQPQSLHTNGLIKNGETYVNPQADSESGEILLTFVSEDTDLAFRYATDL